MGPKFGPKNHFIDYMTKEKNVEFLLFFIVIIFSCLWYIKIYKYINLKLKGVTYDWF